MEGGRGALRRSEPRGLGPSYGGFKVKGGRGYRLGIADEGSCLEELDDELFFFDFTALRFSHWSSLRGLRPAFSRSVLFLW